MDGARLRRKKGGRKKRVGSPVTNVTHDMLFTEDRQTESALVSAILANRQLQVSKSLSGYYTTENKRLEAERDQLTDDKLKAERDALIVIETINKELEELKRDKKQLQNDVKDSLHSAQQKAEEVSKLEEKLKKRDLLVAELQHRVELLTRELDDVKAFRDLRDAHKRELETLQKSFADEKEEIAKARNLRLQLMEERVKLQADRQLLKQRHMSDVRKMAMNLLAEKTCDIDKLNQKLMGERSLFLADARSARDEVETLRPLNEKLRRDVALAKSLEVEYNARGVRQRREISELKLQVKTAEDNLNAVVGEYEKRLQKQAKDHAAALHKVTKERDEALQVAGNIRGELVKLRSLSKQMLERRSDLELFFYEALSDVRMALLQERRAQPCAIDCRHGDFSSSRTNARRKGGNERLMISDRDSRPSMLLPLRLCGDEKNTDQSFFPLIPLSGNSSTTMQECRLVPLKKPHGLRTGALSNSSVSVAGVQVVGPGKPSRIPSVPRAQDLQSVEISQLSWSEKERVLQALFKQLRRGHYVGKSKQATSTDDTEFLLGAVPVNPSENVFMTQQV